MNTFSRLKTITRYCAPGLFALALPLSASAHYLWLLPSQFELGAQEQWITADVAISKTLFRYDALPMPLEGLAITAPDASMVQPSEPQVRQRRSVFDAKLDQDGVYRVAVHDHALFALYKVQGQLKKWHGTEQAFKGLLPADAQDVQVSETDTRLEAFVVRNHPGAMAPTPLGKGLEIIPQAALDSFTRGGHSAFVVLLDGKPARDIPVTLVHNAQQADGEANTVKMTTAADGSFVAQWADAGTYLLTAQARDAHPQLKAASGRRLAYGLTLSVRSD
jgi:hypothetical protein